MSLILRLSDQNQDAIKVLHIQNVENEANDLPHHDGGQFVTIVYNETYKRKESTGDQMPDEIHGDFKKRGKALDKTNRLRSLLSELRSQPTQSAVRLSSQMIQTRSSSWTVCKRISSAVGRPTDRPTGRITCKEASIFSADPDNYPMHNSPGQPKG